MKRRSGAGVSLVAAAILSSALGCASKAGPAGGESGAKTARSPERTWVSPLDRQHVLVGRVLDVRHGRWASPADASAAARASEWVFLGEQHDNVDHHLMQASVVAEMVAAGKRPALVAEMLDGVDQDAIDAARAASPDDPDALPRAVKWEESGWPPWATYRPVFAEAMRAHLAIAGAGLDRVAARGLVKAGLPSLDRDMVERFGLEAPLAPAVHDRLREEMRDAHCGFLPEGMLDGMVLVQRARDALLADRALSSRTGAVVIAGAGHARTDSGAPRALALASGKAALSIAFIEVQSDKTRPEDYAAAFGVASLPFDYVWFTPRASDVDHCEELRKKHPPS